MPLLFRKNNLFLKAINCLYVLQVMLQVVLQTADIRQGAVHISYSHAAC
jgi:hypothetical protein